MTSERPRRPQDSKEASGHRMRRMREASLKPPLSHGEDRRPKADAVLDCGWGRLLFGQTFAEPEDLVRCFRAEGPGRKRTWAQVGSRSSTRKRPSSGRARTQAQRTS